MPRNDEDFDFGLYMIFVMIVAICVLHLMGCDVNPSYLPTSSIDASVDTAEPVPSSPLTKRGVYAVQNETQGIDTGPVPSDSMVEVVAKLFRVSAASNWSGALFTCQERQARLPRVEVLPQARAKYPGETFWSARHCFNQDEIETPCDARLSTIICEE